MPPVPKAIQRCYGCFLSQQPQMPEFSFHPGSTYVYGVDQPLTQACRYLGSEQLFPLLAAFYRRNSAIAVEFHRVYPQRVLGGGNAPRKGNGEPGGQDHLFGIYWNWLFQLSNIPQLHNIDIVLAFIFDKLQQQYHLSNRGASVFGRKC